MKADIGVVIPAFKPTFFDRTLESLANQTYPNFKLYICDDSSSEDLSVIVEKYRKKLDIEYIKFDYNLGQKNLSAQWNRCVSLAKNEWIWFFSDDDLADENCIEELTKSINESNGKSGILRFRTKVIDKEGKVINKKNAPPKTQSAKEFLDERINFRQDSFGSEYVFKKSTWENHGGFINFPLMWYGDDATWATFIDKGYVTTINTASVSWRTSSVNLSSNKNHILLKLYSCILFIIWKQKFEKELNLISPKGSSRFTVLKWLIMNTVHLMRKN
jgi:glycosyltransferase involved in cell wall biosynthesis